MVIRDFQAKVFCLMASYSPARASLFCCPSFLTFDPASDWPGLQALIHEADMKKILFLNGGKQFAHSEGRYNATLHEAGVAFMDRAGFDVKETFIDGGYDLAEEVQKFLWADVIVWQMPGWWMGAPWTVKKYIDEVFTEGHGSLYANDGRTRSDASQKYGSGGLLQGRQYMISATWNAPQQAFDDPTDFFEAKGVDAVYFPFHKANQFLGMTGLPTFLAVDVMKRPDIDNDVKRYEAHLARVFGV
ncbi:putative proteinH quinone dehydrogenase MdaB [Pseudomonas cichorii]|nr:putative proteinH quinone dehydrogenase MdaB [Pseudomonas cichorii]